MKIVVFTGAGISKESGIDTFRKGGKWDEYDVREVAYAPAWYKGDDAAKTKILGFYNARRAEVLTAEPNAAHKALAELEKKHTVTIITQNIDDLHERAGSSRVIHLHGEIMKGRSSLTPRDGSEPPTIPWTGDMKLADRAPDGFQLRPHVVWFEEGLPRFGEAFEVATEPDIDVLIVCGTTLAVGPANQCAIACPAPVSYVVDPEPPDLKGMRGGSMAFLRLAGKKTDDRIVHVYDEPASSGIAAVVFKLMEEEVTVDAD